LRTRTDWAVAAALAASGTLLQLPFLRRGLALHDEGSFLAVADAIRTGSLLYRDLSMPVTPISYESFAAVMGWFGPHFDVARGLVLAAFTATMLIGYATLRQCCSRSAAVLGTLALLPIKPLALPAWTMANYSPLAMLASMAALLALLRLIERRSAATMLAAGVTVALAAGTKQNFGAACAFTLGATLVALVVRCPRSERPRLIADTLWLGAGAALPLLLIASYYGARGALGDLIRETAVGTSYGLLEHYRLPFPWRFGGMPIGLILQSYFPASIATLYWEDRFDIAVPGLFVTLVNLVRLVYLAPLAAAAVATIWLIGGRRAMTQRNWIKLFAVLVFASTMYAGTFYRPDLAHLLHVAPALVVLCVVVGERLAAAGRVWRTALGAAWCVWMLLGIAGAISVFAAYGTPVHTPRGTLWTSRSDAAETAPVLAHLARTPAERRVVFLRTMSFFYFATGRRLPVVQDQVMPGLVNASHDAEIAAQLEQVDEVIYNPRPLATAPLPLAAYAPRIARVLRERFEVSAVISPIAYRLTPAALPPVRTELDLITSGAPDFRLTAPAGPSEAVRLQRVDWLAYPVLGVFTADATTPTCAVIEHTVGSGQFLHALPMLDPDPFPPARSGRFVGVRFAVRVRGQRGTDSAERVVELGPPLLAPPLRIPLDRFRGQRVEIELCASGPLEPRPWKGTPLIGWADLRIVRTAEGADDRDQSAHFLPTS